MDLVVLDEIELGDIKVVGDLEEANMPVSVGALRLEKIGRALPGQRRRVVRALLGIDDLVVREGGFVVLDQRSFADEAARKARTS